MSGIDEYKKQFEEGHISFEEALLYYGYDCYEEGREAGYDNGYDTGHEAGYDTGYFIAREDYEE